MTDHDRRADFAISRWSLNLFVGELMLSMGYLWLDVITKLY